MLARVSASASFTAPSTPIFTGDDDGRLASVSVLPASVKVTPADVVIVSGFASMKNGPGHVDAYLSSASCHVAGGPSDGAAAGVGGAGASCATASTVVVDRRTGG